MALTLFLQLTQSKIDLFIISDCLCLLVLTFCTVSVIGIAVKSHIGTSLITTIIIVQKIAFYICKILTALLEYLDLMQNFHVKFLNTFCIQNLFTQTTFSFI